MANNCHTADVAWCLMYEQKLDIMLKLEATKAKMLRREAKKAEIEEVLNDPNISKSARLNAEADMIEWKSGEGLLELALAGAEQEIATIENIMEELEPLRKYGHLPVLEASQAAQREEWLLEFKQRCENYLLSIGTIPEDQLNAMRNHPDFESQIVPYVGHFVQHLQETKDKLGTLTANRKLLLGN